MQEVKMLLGAVRDIGQAVVNMQKEVAHIHKQVDETRNAVEEMRKGLFGISKRPPINTPGIYEALSLINANVMDAR